MYIYNLFIYNGDSFLNNIIVKLNKIIIVFNLKCFWCVVMCVCILNYVFMLFKYFYINI